MIHRGNQNDLWMYHYNGRVPTHRLLHPKRVRSATPPRVNPTPQDVREREQLYLTAVANPQRALLHLVLTVMWISVWIKENQSRLR